MIASKVTRTIRDIGGSFGDFGGPLGPIEDIGGPLGAHMGYWESMGGPLGDIGGPLGI